MVSVRKRPWHQDSYLLTPLLLGTFLRLLLSTINSSTIPPYIFITYPLGTHILRTSSGDDFISFCPVSSPRCCHLCPRGGRGRGRVFGGGESGGEEEVWEGEVEV